MQGSRFLSTVQLSNLLSYDGKGTRLDLQPLNVLIGSNGSGKSNLVEALTLLAAAPRNLSARIREGGGSSEWIWKGASGTRVAEIIAILNQPSLFYRLVFTSVASRFQLQSENLNEWTSSAQGGPLYFFGAGKARIVTKGEGGRRGVRSLRLEDLDLEQSILSQRRDPDLYPELTYVGTQFGRMRFFRNWDLAALRQPQRTDLPDDFLLPDASNLGLVLNSIENRPRIKRLMLEKLKTFYERVEDFHLKIEGGTIQVVFDERGLRSQVPAVRLSDGTLRFLCLLTILCHPEPPCLICIEEPELGLHPDAISTLAELLVDAASRTQLVVTTHSDSLVSALSEVPEAVVVCEREENGTSLSRLEPSRLADWLERYRLGELWRMGEIGGTRW